MLILREHLEAVEATYRKCIALIEKYQRNEVGRTTRPSIQWGPRDRTRALILIANIKTDMDDVTTVFFCTLAHGEQKEWDWRWQAFNRQAYREAT